jgi:DMSO/TMAO reductase YedYZ molybdopterin-dependent catalytic subunit
MGIVSRGFTGRRRPGDENLPPGQPGFWETLGYHNYGDPWQEQRYWGD